jgi:hypothetical protein
LGDQGLGVGVEGGGRFHGEEDLGVGEEGSREADALALAAAEVSCLGVEGGVEAVGEGVEDVFCGGCV